MKKSQLKSIIRKLLQEQMTATSPGLTSMPGTSTSGGGGVSMNTAQPGLSSMAGQDMSNQSFEGVTVTQLIQQGQQAGAPPNIMRDLKAMRNLMRRGNVDVVKSKANALVNQAQMRQRKKFWDTVFGKLLFKFLLSLVAHLAGELFESNIEEGHCYGEDGKPMPEGHCYEEDGSLKEGVSINKSAKVLQERFKKLANIIK